MFLRYPAVRRLVFCALVCFAVPRQDTLAQDARLRTLMEAYHQEAMELNPLYASRSDDHRYDAHLPIDISPEFREETRALNRRYLEALDGLEHAELTDEDRTNVDILRWTLEAELRLLEHPTHLLPVNQMSSMHLDFVQLASGASIHPFATRQDYENFRSRMEDFSTWVDVAISNMDEGIRVGIVQPRVVVERMLPQLASLDESQFDAPLASLPDDIEDAEAYRRAYRADIRKWVLPAYEKLEAYLSGPYLEAARDTDGLWATPGGREMYAAWVAFWTTTDMTPDDIHAMGLAEVDRIVGRMEVLRKDLGFEGTLSELVESQQSDPATRPFRSAQEVLDAYKAIEDRMEPYLASMFRIRPRMPFEVRQIEAFRAASASAHYQVGAADGSRPGIFYVPIRNAAGVSVAGMEALFAHEAIPGHHFQLALQSEMESLPAFRRYGFHSAFMEGWALYTESLGKELGLYTDPASEMAMLGSELFRAVRLVVDTGMHAKGWTRQEAVAYLLEAMPTAGPQAAGFAMNQMERYLILPGQALAYKTGERTITRLRAEAEQKMGSAFDIRDFHDYILTGAAMPLDVLEQRMHAWMTR